MSAALDALQPAADDYPDDFTDLSDDQDLPLPGLHAPPASRVWAGGDDWRLPGLVQQSETSRSSSSSSNGDDGDSLVGVAGARTPGYPAGAALGSPAPRAPATAAPDSQQRNPWRVMQLDTSTASPSAASAAGTTQTRFAGSAALGGGGSGNGGGGGGGGVPLRHTSVASGRSLFGPFGSTSLQHRDSLQGMRQDPLTLTVQHHQSPLTAPPPPPPVTLRPPPSPRAQRAPPSPRTQRSSPTSLLQRLPSMLSQPLRLQGQPQHQPQAQEQQQQPELQPQQVQQDQDREQEGRTGAMSLRLREDRSEDDEGNHQGRVRGGGGGGDAWRYLEADTYGLTGSSSCSSSVSDSRDVSPRPYPAVAQPYSAAVPGRSSGQRPWYISQYDDSQYDSELAGLGLGLGTRLGRHSSDLGDPEDPSGGEGGPRGAGLPRDLASMGLALPGDGPAADTTHGSSRSSGISWETGRAELLEGRYEAAGPSGSQPMAASMVLWPLGAPGDVRRSGVGGVVGGGARAGGIAAGFGGEADWRLGPGGGLRHRRAAQGRAGELSGGWQRSQRQQDDDDDEEEDEDGAEQSMAGTSSSAMMRSSEDPSWEHQYAAGLGARSSLRLSFAGSSSSGPRHRYSPRSTLGDSDLSGLGPSPTAHLAAGGRVATPGGIGDYRGGGLGVSGVSGGGLGGSGGGGATLCFTSLDSPSGPYERRRVVLTSAHRRNTDASTPSVRQYSDGLAGMLTNAQIQEWMSQHASRLLLPRHMQEIADIVFRPPSAVPEKKPLNCQAGGVTALPPPVVLGGRYPPLHISRLVGDSAFLADLLSGLPGVDPAHSRLQAVLTALQGQDVVVVQEGEAGGEQPAGRIPLSKGLRPTSRLQPK